jgi:hypothetical protein
MSPSDVVIVSSPPATSYSAGVSRTIAFQRSLSRLEPSNSSSKLGPAAAGRVMRNESNAASGGVPVVAWLPMAKTPRRAFAGSGQARPAWV